MYPFSTVLVLDYERHDTNFSEEKILEMQRCFVDAADMGRLYVNVPVFDKINKQSGRISRFVIKLVL